MPFPDGRAPRPSRRGDGRRETSRGRAFLVAALLDRFGLEKITSGQSAEESHMANAFLICTGDLSTPNRDL